MSLGICSFLCFLRAEPLEHPKINAQYLRPAIDAQHFLSVNETALETCGSFLVKEGASQSSNPFLSVANGGYETGVLTTLDIFDLAGGLVFCCARPGIHAPINLRAAGALPLEKSLWNRESAIFILDYKYRVTKTEDKMVIAVSMREKYAY